jgi:hypothetical protein
MLRGNPSAAFVVSLLSLILISGCVSRQAGKDGNLEFRYQTDDIFVDFDKAIAVGAKLDLFVHPIDGEEGATATVETATSDRAETIDVTSHSGNVIYLEAKAAGAVEISVSADLPGLRGTVSDRVDIRATVPDAVKAWHLCKKVDERDGVYLTSQNLWIPFEMEENGRPVIGYDYYPVEFEPTDSIAVQYGHKSQQFIRLKTTDVPQDITMRSILDETELNLKIVTHDAIDGLELATPGREIQSGSTDIVHVFPTTAGQRICQAQTAIDVASKTPDTCGVRNLVEFGQREELLTQYGWLEVEGLRPGRCAFEVTYADAGFAAELEVTIR